ncbi:MAG: glycosyltransferase family 4 protein [Acidobacteriota bacterium]
MHIAYIHYLFGRDTAFQHVRQFADGARALGHRVDVHAGNLAPASTNSGSGGGRPPLTSRFRAWAKRHFGRYLHDPKEFYWNARYIPRETALLRTGNRPDVLLVRSQGLSISAPIVARRLDLPLVLEINGPLEELAKYRSEYVNWLTLRRWCGRYKRRRAQAITVVSGALAAHFADDGVASDKLFVVPNGADIDVFHPGIEPDSETLERLGATAGSETNHGSKTVIGYVGSFQPWHDMDRLARLVTTVASQRDATCFLFVGAGSGMETLRDALAPLGERVLFTGRVPHERVPALVACLDIGVLAEAAWYQCPLKVLEWMAAGRAIVAPGHGPLGELMRDGEEGLLFPPGNDEAMVETVLDLVDDPERRRALGAAAAERARTSLTWQDNARRVVDACQHAIDRHRAAKSESTKLNKS